MPEYEPSEMLVWLPQAELAAEVGEVHGVDIEVVPEWRHALSRTSSRTVEVVVPPNPLDVDPKVVLGKLPNLRIVQLLTAGVEHIVDAIPDGVALVDAQGVHTPATAEWVCAVVLAAQRGLMGFWASQLEQKWRPEQTRTLAEAVVLIVGAGSIGSAVEAGLKPFGCSFLRVARTERYEVSSAKALPELLPLCDVVVITVPLTAETMHLVDDEFLAHMRPGSLLVNASRGAVVETAALCRALTAGRVRAAVDVIDPEPLPDGHFVWSTPGLLITPHIAADVPTSLRLQAAMLRHRLSAWAAGEAPRDPANQGY